MVNNKPWRSKKTKPPLGKTPKLTESPPSDAKALFKWKVADKYIDYYYDKLGWCNCESPVVLLKDVVKELQAYEGISWQTIRQKSEHNHSWNFQELPKDLRERLINTQKDYLSELYQLALDSECRIWGFKDITIFYLIWYDPCHEGYKTKAK